MRIWAPPCSVLLVVLSLLMLHGPQIPSQPEFSIRVEPASKREPLTWAAPHGVTILLMGEDPQHRFDRNLADAGELGSKWVQITFPAYQYRYNSIRFPQVDRRAPTPSQVAQSIHKARSSGFRIALHPILLLQDDQGSHWRGNLQPDRPTEWFQHYQQWITTWARIAQQQGVEILFVGSEFSSLEKYQTQWSAIVKEVRQIYKGLVTYSANWDSWPNIPFSDEIDALGINSYQPYEMTQDPTHEDLIHQMLPLRSKMLLWSRANKTPIYFSELGYPSHERAAEAPWDQSRGERADPLQQKRLHHAFLESFFADSEIQGVFFYALHGDGGISDRGYTPRGKPVLELFKKHLEKFSEKVQKLP
ncbi:MAG: hypothetical protein AAEJ04_07780 [Planctomycetota bacterium]